MSYFKGIQQEVTESSGNTNSTNLESGATWAGTPVSTLGVVGLQWNLNTDQNCTIYSEESAGSHTGLGTVATTGTTTLSGTDTVFTRSFVVGDTISVANETDRVIATIVSNTELTVTVAFTNTASGLTYTHYHWDISYPFDFVYKAGIKGDGETVQATMSYWRLRVVNEGMATTTFFRVSGVLCPIATPLPSALSDDRRLKTETTISGKTNTARHVWVNPTNELATSPVYRMVGTAFDNSGNAGAVDTNFWTAAITNSGSVVQAGGVITLSTTTTDSTSVLTSVRRARFVAGSAMLFQGGFASSAAVANNTRRIGAYDDDNGVFAQLAGTTFSIGTRKDGAANDILVNSGSFNGDMGVSFAPVADKYYKLTIEYSPLAAYFYVNGKLLHSVTGGNYSDTMTLPARMENNNDGTDAATTFKSIGIYIARQGELVTNPAYTNITTSTTTICKYGAGVLRRIVVNDPSQDFGAVIYDNTSATAPIMASISLGTKAVAPASIEYEVGFSNGLTVVTNAACDITIVYE